MQAHKDLQGLQVQLFSGSKWTQTSATPEQPIGGEESQSVLLSQEAADGGLVKPLLFVKKLRHGLRSVNQKPVLHQVLDPLDQNRRLSQCVKLFMRFRQD